MKEEQVTLRLPGELARAIDDRARALGVPKSQVVREAIAAYLAEPPARQVGSSWERVVSMVGSLQIDPAAIEQDALADQIRAHNWRE